MLNEISELFYDPWLFWGVPLVIVVVSVAARHVLAWLHRVFGRN